MLKIRLTRRGKKNDAFFRIVVAEHTAPIKGGFLEVLGFLNPHTKEKSFKTDRIEYWIGKGAQCSDTVHNLLVSNAVIKGPKRAVKMKMKKKPVEEVKLENVKPAETAEAKPEPASPAGEETKPAEAKEEKKKEEVKSEKEKPEMNKKEEKAEELKPEELKEEKK